ncbi:MAG: hypothetical protein E7254_07970 [Lachnospiraceae bacterium]|nr:hypothetical protein [Lachnospiraceae bacterium]
MRSILKKVLVYIFVMVFAFGSIEFSNVKADDEIETVIISSGEVVTITTDTYVYFTPETTAEYNIYSVGENVPFMTLYEAATYNYLCMGYEEIGNNFYVTVELQAGVEYLIDCYDMDDMPFELHLEMASAEEAQVTDIELSISNVRPYLVKGQLEDGDIQIGYIKNDGKYYFNLDRVREMIKIKVYYSDDTTIEWAYKTTEQILNKKQVDYEISDTSEWCAKGDNLVQVTYEGITKSISIPVKNQIELEINGVSISYLGEGARTVYSIEDSTKTVEEVGLIYGLTNYIEEADLYVGNKSDNVFDFRATTKGKIRTEGNKDIYAMTMKFGNVSSNFFEENISVRAYAKLDDGTYEYSDVGNYTIFNVANRLYTEKQMPTKEGHDYLYNNILGYVNPQYVQIEY